MNFESVIVSIESQIRRDLTPEEIGYLNIAYQAGRNAQARRDLEIVEGRVQP